MLLDEHAREFLYELRQGGFDLDDVLGRRAVEVEAWMSVRANEPDSHLHAAIHEWDYPLSREGQLTMQEIDLLGQANTPKGKRWKPLPRPWKSKDRQKLGWTDLPRSEAIALLQANAGR